MTPPAPNSLYIPTSFSDPRQLRNAISFILGQTGETRRALGITQVTIVRRGGGGGGGGRG